MRGGVRERNVRSAKDSPESLENLSLKLVLGLSVEVS